MLWDNENPNYNKKPVRNKAYAFIQNKMGLDSVDTVRRKIKAFRDTYLCETKKIRRSEQLCKVDPDEEPYQPRIKWFAIMDSCIGESRCSKDSFEEFVPDEINIVRFFALLLRYIYRQPVYFTILRNMNPPKAKLFTVVQNRYLISRIQM